MQSRSTSRRFLIRAWYARLTSNVCAIIGFPGSSSAKPVASANPPGDAARDFGELESSKQAGIDNNEPTFSLAFDAMNARERQAENTSESPASLQTRSAQATGNDVLASATGS